MGSLLVTVALLITYTIFTRQRLKKKKIKVSPLSYICFYLFGLYICTVMEITGPGNILDIPHNICLKFIWIPFNDIIFGYSLKFALFEFRHKKTAFSCYLLLYLSRAACLTSITSLRL